VQRADHHVDHLGVAHARAEACGQAGIGRAAHDLGAGADGNVGVAEQNRLAGADDGLQARAAQAVDVEGRRVLAAAALECRDAREVHVLGFGVDDVAEDHVADVLALHLRARERLAHDQRAQFGGRNVFQAAAKGANGGAHGADDDDFTGHGFSPV